MSLWVSSLKPYSPATFRTELHPGGCYYTKFLPLFQFLTWRFSRWMEIYPRMPFLTLQQNVFSKVLPLFPPLARGMKSPIFRVSAHQNIFAVIHLKLLIYHTSPLTRYLYFIPDRSCPATREKGKIDTVFLFFYLLSNLHRRLLEKVSRW